LGQLTFDDLLRLLKKYGFILIIYELTTRFGLTYINRIYFEIFPITDLSTLNDLTSAISAGTILFCNIILGLILLSDLDKRQNLTWLILGLTLLNPWMGIMFFFISKNIELKTFDTKE
jgi:hypothetical protein